MTFDDGIVMICNVENAGESGERPIKRLYPIQELYYAEDTLGITRYYEAIKAEQLIEAVISVPDEIVININQMAVLEDKSQFQIRMVQKEVDEFGNKILKLSLERNGEEYEIYSADV